MVDDLSYQSLDVTDGGSAVVTWLRMRHESNGKARELLRQQLLDYCRMDTYAMVKILEKMQQIAKGDVDQNTGVIGDNFCQGSDIASNCARLKEGKNLEHNSSNFTNEAITRYFSELQFRMNIYDNAKKDMDVYLASSFNVFDYIKTDENKLSDIMADLLNPEGKHGQKDAFLQEFIKLLTDDFSYDLNTCRVARETSTAYIANNQRRMDITLKFADKFEIAIENKPWDSEQENQLQDYQEHLTRKYGEKFCLVYITGDGSPPVSIEPELKEQMLDEGRLVVLTYADEMLTWLEHCYKECKAEKIRNFIKDFMQYIESEFQNSYDDGEDEEDGE